MTIECPACRARYRIDTSKTDKEQARIKCPRCAHVFTISIERAAPPARPAVEQPSVTDTAPTPAPADEQRPSGPPRILIVDDSNTFRQLIVEVLTPLQLELLTAADGLAALGIIRREQPDLVILDLNLPQMTGFEVIRHVRAEPSVKHTPFLVLSGVYRKEPDADKVRHAGADDFMTKSFQPDQLLLRVKKLLHL